MQIRGQIKVRVVPYALLMCLLLAAPTSTHDVFTSFSHLSTVACIVEVINCGPCWRKDILKVKGQAEITKCYFRASKMHSLMRQQVPMVFLLLLIYLCAVACSSEEMNLGPCWRKDILGVKSSSIHHKLQHFMCLYDLYVIIEW